MKNEIKKIILIAFGLSLAINFSEILYYLNSPVTLFETTRPTSIPLIIYRLIAFFLFCFSVLYLNIYKIDTWIKKYTSKYTFLGSLIINGILYYITLIPFLYIQEQFIVKLPIAEHKGLSFVWMVFLIICMLIATIVKIRSRIAKKLVGQQQFVRYSKDGKSFKHDLEVLERNYLTSLLLPVKKVLEPIRIKEFALFYIDDGIVKGKTFDSKIYFIDKPIQELEDNLNPAVFFRTNRQYLINRNAVKHITPDSYGKIGLTLKINHVNNIVISKLKTKVFKDWLVEFPG